MRTKGEGGMSDWSHAWKRGDGSSVCTGSFC